MVTSAQRLLFDRMLDEIIDALPEQLHELLEEVPLIVEDEPSAALLADLEMEDDDADLCGLHWGTPLTERSVGGGDGMPDRMMIFRGPIFSLAGVGSGSRLTPAQQDELYRQIRITVLHEIGHHFGLNEDDLDTLGYG
ncbi:metallopeptidase family protein [Phycisphaerales bacterium AB-hyl4]|uniref:Metallopeptidase family protein n=1 Tax=Natronomicrosphaera hydrolytica TaxID=3242702 RepID=A0ABV4U8H8_9BACT